jgi:prepilin-type N-terminal cleavage/methylation domain-containing protein
MRARRRIAAPDGFTLIEVLMTAIVGTIVMLGLFQVLDVSVTQSGRVRDRIDAVGRARVAMELLTRQIRSQVCVAASGNGIANADANTMTLYVDLTGGASIPEKHILTYDPVAKTLTESDYVGTGTWPATTYPGQPTRANLLASNVVPVAGVSIFRYYAFTTSGQVSPGLALTSTPLSANDISRTVNIAISFVVQPSGSTASPQATSLQDQVLFRNANPNDSTAASECV